VSKTLFHPGKAVTTTWLNSSQYFGPSNPGVVFVANPINDFEYPLLKANSFDFTDVRSYFVATTTNQTVDGEKTFLVSPKVPTATLTSGTQAVNINRLNTDLAALNTSISTTTAANLASAIAPINTALSNVVNLSGAQTVTGAKTFDDIRVPLTPGLANSPVSLDFYNQETVTLTDAQTIAGVKTFSSPAKVPNPIAGLDAVNLQTLNSLFGGINNPQVSNGCIKIGNIQIVFGNFPVFGTWNSTGPLSASHTYTASAPNMSPFTSVVGGGGSLDRLSVTQFNFSNTGVTFIGDTANTANPQPNDGTVFFVVFGYI
jgi:hypothetical protein